MSLLQEQHIFSAIYLATLGKKADTPTLDYFGRKLESNKTNPTLLANALINSHDGQNRYDGLNNSEKISFIFKNVTGTKPDSTTLAALVLEAENGTTLGSIAISIINRTENYSGTDQNLLQQKMHLENAIITTLYPSFDKTSEYTSYASDIQAVYYVIGGAMVSSGINFWANDLINNPDKLNKIAQNFISTRPSLDNLNNEDFIKTIFKNTFNKEPSSQDISNYLTGLNNSTETRGDVVVRMINDIRNDDSNSQANVNFNKATKVYLSGEMPDLKYQEVVASFYLVIAKSSVPADALDTYSKMLAAGTTEVQLLKTLSASTQFDAATDYGAIYQYLYGNNLTTSESQAILLKANYDKLQATVLIIDAFRNGKYPLDNHPTPPSHSLLLDFEKNIGISLNYQKSYNGEFGISNNGKLTAEINTQHSHELTNAEIASLLILTDLKINANSNHSIDLSFINLNSIKEILLTGEYATSDLVRSGFSGQQHMTLMLNDSNIATANGSMQQRNASVIIDSKAQLNTAKIEIRLDDNGFLSWVGNSINGGANIVGKDFTALNIHGSAASMSPFDKGIISANLISKDIFLTSDENGSVQAEIASSLNQFLYFSTIDLTHYRGTGSIYMNGVLVATEGRNTFDFGLIDQRATIFNSAYNNVTHLQQTDKAKDQHGDYTGSQGAIISEYSGELTLLNVSNSLFRINGDLTKQSHINIYDTLQSDNTFTIGFTDVASSLRTLDMGTFSFTSAHKNMLEVYMSSSPDHQQERSLTLTGGDNHISTLQLNGHQYITDQLILLNLKIESNFSDNLKTIKGGDYNEGRISSIMHLNLISEKQGTGGGSFYSTLKTLDNSAEFSPVIDSLAGDQLTVSASDGGLIVHSATVMGNTTLGYAQTLNFADSKIDNMVTLESNYSQAIINVGNSGSQWTFSFDGPKNAVLYGNATSSTELNTLFTGLTASDSAQNLFSQVLAKITNGASDHNLSEVGVMKLDKSVYVIVDQNHNQMFDADDIVFSVGNQDPYFVASALHYKAPAITVNGSATESLLTEAIA